MKDSQSHGSHQDAEANVIAGIASVLGPARIRFLGLILDRILAFEALRKHAETGDNAPLALANIADLAHKISGVAATLGFERVGGLAGAVERCIRDGQASLAAPAHFRTVVEPLLEALLVAMEDLLDD